MACVVYKKSAFLCGFSGNRKKETKKVKKIIGPIVGVKIGFYLNLQNCLFECDNVLSLCYLHVSVM